MLRRLTLALPLCLAALAVPVLAAEPGSGTVSKDAPKVEWTGEAAGYGTSVVADVNGSFFGPCQAPNCDEFSLEVKDPADLTVALTTSDGSGFMTMEVEKPDGSIVYDGGSADAATTSIKVKKAAPGTYLVRAQTNNTVADDYGYQGVATLAVAGSAPAPAPTPAPGQPAAPPAPAPAATLAISTRKASAKRTGRALGVAVRSDRPVTKVALKLRKGKRTLGSAKLAKLDGAKRMKLKLKRRLERGRYILALTAVDERGAVVGASARLKVKR